MKVAVIGSPWIPTPPPAYGGTEAVLDGLVTGLVRAGHEVLFAGHPDSTVPCDIVSPLAPGDIGPIGHGVSELAHVLGAHLSAAQWGADVVHDHSLCGPLVAAGVSDRPLVVTNHGSFDELTLPIFRQMRHAHIVAISRSQASCAVDLELDAIVHHGLDLQTWPIGRGDGGYVLFLGRMHPDKGPDRAIRLANRAGVPILLAAKMREEEECAYFESEVRPLLGQDAVYVGEVDAPTKKTLLSGALALVNPIGWMEPFGMVMIEALACGTPVIASAIGSAAEIVVDGETGFLCTTDDEFVSALADVVDVCRRRCRAAAEERFTIERMVTDYVAVYERAIRRSAWSELRAEGCSSNTRNGLPPITG